MRRALVGGVALGLALAVGACSGETEILVKVGRAAGAPSAIPELRVYAAVGNGQTEGQAQVYIDQADPQADVDVSARDLAARPYTLAISPGAGLGDAPIQLAAVAYQAGAAGGAPRALAFAALDHTVAFAHDKVLEYELDLGPVPSSGVTVDPRGCADFAIGAQPVHIGAQDDWDCDGDPHGTDCNDLNPHINSMATEVCGNSVDEDCDGKIDEDNDDDGDGFTTCAGDCIDNPSAQLPDGLTAAMIHPGATEIDDNAIDENCDGTCAASSKTDFDQDHYTTTGILTTPSTGGMCTQSDKLVDCDDMDATVNPGATEVANNGKDDDCNGTCDVDADGDGYTPSGFLEPPTNGVCAPIPGDLVDCNDGDPTIHPGATEICDGIDENCDGKCDDDTDGDGYSACGTVTQDPTMCVVVTGPCQAGEQCDCAPGSAAAHPVPSGGQAVAERCDGYDENCDGTLFPQQEGCFATGGSTMPQCFGGTRSCDDANPAQPWGDCNVDMNQPVDPRLCSAYAACFTNPTVADPLACTMVTAGIGVLDCDENVMMGSGACSPAVWPLATLVSSGSCLSATWTLLPGTMSGPWTAGFNDGESNNAAGCMATFEVSKYDATKSTTGDTPYLVTQTSGTESVSVIVQISPVTATVCVTPDNLLCTGP